MPVVSKLVLNGAGADAATFAVDAAVGGGTDVSGVVGFAAAGAGCDAGGDCGAAGCRFNNCAVAGDMASPNGVTPAGVGFVGAAAGGMRAPAGAEPPVVVVDSPSAVLLFAGAGAAPSDGPDIPNIGVVGLAGLAAAVGNQLLRLSSIASANCLPGHDVLAACACAGEIEAGLIVLVSGSAAGGFTGAGTDAAYFFNAEFKQRGLGIMHALIGYDEKP